MCVWRWDEGWVQGRRDGEGARVGPLGRTGVGAGEVGGRGWGWGSHRDEEKSLQCVALSWLWRCWPLLREKMHMVLCGAVVLF